MTMRVKTDTLSGDPDYLDYPVQDDENHRILRREKTEVLCVILRVPTYSRDISILGMFFVYRVSSIT